MSRTLVVLAGTIVFTLSGGPSALTFASDGPHDSAGASGPDALTRAAAVALAATAGGRVTGTDVHHEECYYEVEIALGNGEQVDFHLDESLHVLHWHPDVADDGAARD
jgi:hypothetical protein